MLYFKVSGDMMFIPETQILKLFRSRNNGEWYVTLPDWTNVKVEGPIPHRVSAAALFEMDRS